MKQVQLVVSVIVLALACGVAEAQQIVATNTNVAATLPQPPVAQTSK